VRVAIVHYWLVCMRGFFAASKLLEALCDMYTAADIFTHVVAVDSISAKLRRHRIKTSYRKLRGRAIVQEILPLMRSRSSNSTCALRSRHHSESGPARACSGRPIGVHVCYVHSPMRLYLEQYADYRASAGLMSRSQHARFFQLLANGGMRVRRPRRRIRYHSQKCRGADREILSTSVGRRASSRRGGEFRSGWPMAESADFIFHGRRVGALHSGPNSRCLHAMPRARSSSSSAWRGDAAELARISGGRPSRILDASIRLEAFHARHASRRVAMRPLIRSSPG